MDKLRRTFIKENIERHRKRQGKSIKFQLISVVLLIVLSFVVIALLTAYNIYNR